MTLPIIDMSADRPLAPRVTTFTKRFWDALGDGRLLATRCKGCDRLSFPPKTHCPGCLVADIDWVELSGRGRLYSATRVHAGPARFAADIPYAIGIVDLDEGVRLVTRLLGEAGPGSLDEEIDIVVTRYRDGPLFAAMLARELDAAS